MTSRKVLKFTPTPEDKAKYTVVGMGKVGRTIYRAILASARRKNQAGPVIKKSSRRKDKVSSFKEDI